MSEPAVAVRREHAPDDFEDIERELCSSDREASIGFDPFTEELDAFRTAIRESHWAVPHGRLW